MVTRVLLEVVVAVVVVVGMGLGMELIDVELFSDITPK